MNATTAILTLWPAEPIRLAPRARVYRLEEGFRPVWTGLPARANGGHPLASLPESVLVSTLAGHLAAAGRLARLRVAMPGRCRVPLILSEAQRAAVLQAFAGRSLTVLRFDGSCLSDEQVAEARSAGVAIELVHMPVTACADGQR